MDASIPSLTPIRNTPSTPLASPGSESSAFQHELELASRVAHPSDHAATTPQGPPTKADRADRPTDRPPEAQPNPEPSDNQEAEARAPDQTPPSDDEQAPSAPEASETKKDAEPAADQSAEEQASQTAAVHPSPVTAPAAQLAPDQPARQTDGQTETMSTQASPDRQDRVGAEGRTLLSNGQAPSAQVEPNAADVQLGHLTGQDDHTVPVRNTQPAGAETIDSSGHAQEGTVEIATNGHTRSATDAPNRAPTTKEAKPPAQNAAETSGPEQPAQDQAQSVKVQPPAIKAPDAKTSEDKPARQARESQVNGTGKAAVDTTPNQAQTTSQAATDRPGSPHTATDRPSDGVDTADRARFVQRVARAFQSAAARHGPVRLRLHPPELGSIRMELVLRGGQLTARVETESAAARNLLLDHLPALRDRLVEHDIKIQRFDVHLAGRGQDHSTGQPDYRAPQHDESPGGRLAPDLDAADGTEPPPAGRPNHLGNLDITA